MNTYLSELKLRFYYLVLAYAITHLYCLLITPLCLSYLTNNNLNFHTLDDFILCNIMVFKFLVNNILTHYIILILFIYFYPIVTYRRKLLLFIISYTLFNLFYIYYMIHHILPWQSECYLDTIKDTGIDIDTQAIQVLEMNLDAWYDYHDYCIEFFLLILIPYHLRIYYLLNLREFSMILLIEFIFFMKYFSKIYTKINSIYKYYHKKI